MDRQEAESLIGAGSKSWNIRLKDLHKADERLPDLSGVDLRKQNLSGFEFAGLCLAKADLSPANLRDATLRDAKLQCAQLTGTNLRGADLRDAVFSQDSLRQACIDQATRLAIPFGADDFGSRESCESRWGPAQYLLENGVPTDAARSPKR